MKSIQSFPKIFIATKFVDFRLGIQGLSAVVQAHMDLNPFEHSLFVFINKRKSSIKCLYWDKNGFALWQKRLEKDRYAWIKKSDSLHLSISQNDADLLLDGVDIWKIKRHKNLLFSKTT